MLISLFTGQGKVCVSIIVVILDSGTVDGFKSREREGGLTIYK